MTVTKTSHSIHRVLKKDKKNKIVWHNKKFINTRSQDLEKFYQDAAQCYWYKIKNYKKKKNPRMAAVELSEMEAKDINTMEDLKFLKLLYKLRLKKHRN
jgi:N-acylneuraminate cytidylyltransferase